MFTINRRDFLKAGSIASLPALPLVAQAQERAFKPQPGQWRTFEFTTRAEVPAGKGTTRVWLPVPSVNTDYQRSLENTWTSNAASAELTSDGQQGARMLTAVFNGTEA
ncbi:MAG TPA: transglutaminase, partial [Burkholderiaceae bacterium]|nr:transglutaminase [Burkholderiaceae bacterium]